MPDPVATIQNSDPTPTLLAGDPPAVAPAVPPADPVTPAVTQIDDPNAPPAVVADPNKPPATPEPVVPEKYEFVMPEGVPLDEKAVEAFTPIARELKLTQDQAQKLVDLQTESVKRAAEAQAEAWSAQVKTWQEEVKADKEIGGANFEPSLNAAKAVIAKYGDDGLKQALDKTGMGNNPSLIRLFAKIGKAMAEDTVRTGANAAKADPVKSLYTNSQMN